MSKQALISVLQNAFSMELHSSLTDEEILVQVREKVNELISHDFQHLVNILYRIDVSEQKLKQLLKADEGGDAAGIISHLIIERQMEKIKNRQHFKNSDNNNDVEEKW